MYLSAVPTKRILYNDILAFQKFGVASSGSVSQILTNGISRPRYLLICPYLSGHINGSTSASLTSSFTAGIGPLGFPANSPFSSSPATTGPQAAISNLNILVSGSNIYQSNYIYGYEEVLQEVRGSNGVNGGIPLGFHQEFFPNLTGRMDIDLFM